jgi:hypothetical protein
MKTLAEKFAEKYNSMTRDEQAFAFGLEMDAHSSDEHKGFEFKDGSIIEFNAGIEVEKTGESVSAFKPQPKVNVKTVLNAIIANNNNPAIVIKRFSLARMVNKTFSNGLVKAGYYLHGGLVFELTE